ncbi:spore coat U domain-containing protein, partial [Pseudomonas sp. MWU13-2625]
AGTGTGAAQSLTVYGQVPAQATPKPDTYQTTVTATVYF